MGSAVLVLTGDSGNSAGRGEFPLGTEFPVKAPSLRLLLPGPAASVSRQGAELTIGNPIHLGLFFNVFYDEVFHPTCKIPMWTDSLSSSCHTNWVSGAGSFPRQPNSVCFLRVMQPVLQS